MELNQKQFILISLEGNIGAGKSTLFQMIKKQFPQAVYLEEPIEAWQSLNNNPELNVLEKFYEDTVRWGFTFQIYALQSRLQSWEEQLKNVNFGANQILVFTERSLESAREIFCKNCFRSGLISELEFAMYEDIFAWLMNRHRSLQIDQAIYIKTPAEECIARIERRGRGEENGITLAYLQQLEKMHEDWLCGDNQHADVEIIDATQNYISDEKVYENVVDQIKKAIQRIRK